MPVAPRDGNDLAWLFYTSGTTGRPKGAMLTHRVLAQASFAYLTEVDAAAPGDSILHAAPMSHGSGLYMMAHVARLGINVVPESGGFEPDEIFRLFAHWPRMSMFAAPTMVKRLVDFGGDANPANLRTIVWGGAPMYVEDALKALDRFGPRLAQIYGQGESPMTITTLSQAGHRRPRASALARAARLGRPALCLPRRDGGGRARTARCPSGETGEILCRGDVVMPGYWRNPEATAQTLRGGWLHTGDVGAFDARGLSDAEGPLQGRDHLGRLQHLSARGRGGAAASTPRVREASVIGRPHPEWGEVVVAYVVGEARAAELDALCLSEIARFKRPKDYVFVDALPKNNYGKILKTELRELDGKRA